MTKLPWPPLPPKKRQFFFGGGLSFFVFDIWSKHCLGMLKSIFWIGRNSHRVDFKFEFTKSAEKNFRFGKIAQKGSFCLCKNYRRFQGWNEGKFWKNCFFHFFQKCFLLQNYDLFDVTRNFYHKKQGNGQNKTTCWNYLNSTSDIIRWKLILFPQVLR